MANSVKTSKIIQTDQPQSANSSDHQRQPISKYDDGTFSKQKETNRDTILQFIYLQQMQSTKPNATDYTFVCIRVLPVYELPMPYNE
mmetsp:Transcript_46196/g.75377  ORF Transcript_46196/g.75377 Transcript_46196/m.75377 type:complete len:87 (+) Transcript_46196:13-273(+)